MNKLTGTGVAMVTPFQANGALDLPALAKLTNYLIEGGIDLLVILGTTGESATLTAQEQEAVIETILKANNSRRPFALGVGGNDTAKVCAKAKAWSKTYQPDAFLSVSPYYNKPSQEGIFRHFSAIAESSDTPIILYNVPGRTAGNMLAATTVKLAKAYPHVAAMKEASGNFEQIMEIARDRPAGFSLLSGDDALTLPMIATGANGVISVVGNALPKQFSEMVRLARNSEMEAARKLHLSMLNFTKLLFSEGNPAGIKAALELLGIGEEHVRLPLVAASAGLKAAIKAELKVLGAI